MNTPQHIVSKCPGGRRGRHFCLLFFTLHFSALNFSAIVYRNNEERPVGNCTQTHTHTHVHTHTYTHTYTHTHTVGNCTHTHDDNYILSEEVGHASSLVIQCHVIVVNIVNTRADPFWNLFKLIMSTLVVWTQHGSSKPWADVRYSMNQCSIPSIIY